MNKKFFVLIIAFMFCSVYLTANASYYYDDGKNENNPYVDKFKPTSGVKIKESNVANWMENATRNAMNGNKNNSQKSSYNSNRRVQTQSSSTYKKSYKWF